ncbi:MAG: hypothetical protein LBU83_05470 [Bacteroidales bacterium]|jgi:hypothetical protein|nr:hypothetical protein [Bacteroidales bacterium]
MKTIFRYFLLLSVVIIPLFVLYQDEEKFPILFGAFLGITVTYWIAVWIMKKREK